MFAKKTKGLVKNTSEPWTNVYGLARTFLALCTLTAFIGHTPEELFFHYPGSEYTRAMHEGTIGRYSLYYLLRDHALLAKWGSIAVLGIVVLGWRPRVTGILHWYISYSFAASCLIVQGGDHVVANLTLILLPVTLLDGRRFHWQEPQDTKSSSFAGTVQKDIARLCFVIAGIQVAIIYFSSGVSKLDVAEWANGTAFYYWFTHPVFGAPNWLRTVIGPLLSYRVFVVTATWGAIILEIFLASGLVAKEKFKPWMLALGILFHAAIAAIHGLFTFFLAMFGALILFLVDPTYHIRFSNTPRVFGIPKVLRKVAKGVGRLRETRPSAETTQ